MNANSLLNSLLLNCALGVLPLSGYAQTVQNIDPAGGILSAKSNLDVISGKNLDNSKCKDLVLRKNDISLSSVDSFYDNDLCDEEDQEYKITVIDSLQMKKIFNTISKEMDSKSKELGKNLLNKGKPVRIYKNKSSACLGINKENNGSFEVEYVPDGLYLLGDDEVMSVKLQSTVFASLKELFFEPQIALEYNGGNCKAIAFKQDNGWTVVKEVAKLPRTVIKGAAMIIQALCSKDASGFIELISWDKAKNATVLQNIKGTLFTVARSIGCKLNPNKIIGAFLSSKLPFKI